PSMYTATRQIAFSDDEIAGAGMSLVELSIPGVAAMLRKARVPMLIFASWYDAGTVQGTLQRFHDYPGPQRIFIGAWSHGGAFNADPFLAAGAGPSAEQQQRREALRFFEHYLKDASDGGIAASTLSYYTIGATRWQATDVWPPRGLRRMTYYLAPDGQL